MSERSEGVTLGDVSGGIINSMIAGRDVIQKFFVSDQDERDRRNKKLLLEKVRSFWIAGVLQKSVYRELLIQLGKQEQNAAVDHPWNTVLATAGQPSQALPSTKSILEIFEEQGQSLLILGEPGSGKTITLLELAEASAERVLRDPLLPIPVVLNLSSWSAGKPLLLDWLVEELNLRYQIPRKIGRAWVDNNDLMLLLDGLDEVEVGRRNACVEAINEFRQDHGLTPVAICSRVNEYEDLSARLKLQGAILLLPLTSGQIDEYFIRAGPSLSSVRALVRRESSLRELARSPLMLSVMSLAFQKSADKIPQPTLNDTAWSPTDLLFNAYVARMFSRRKARSSFSPEATRDGLRWLARRMIEHSQSVFLMEDLQPSWLRSGAQRGAYLMAARLAAVAILSGPLVLAVALNVSDLFEIYGWKSSRLFGVLIVLFAGAGLVIGAFDTWRLARNAGDAGDHFRSNSGFGRSVIGVLTTSLLAIVGFYLSELVFAFTPFGVGYVEDTFNFLSLLLVSEVFILWDLPFWISFLVPVIAALLFGVVLGPRWRGSTARDDIRPVESLRFSWRVYLIVLGAAAVLAGATWAYTASILVAPADVWNTEGGHISQLEIPASELEMGHIAAAAFNRDGTRIATIDNDYIVRLFDTVSGAEVPMIRPSKCRFLNAIEFSPDGGRLMMTSHFCAQVWDAAGAENLVNLESVEPPEFSPDGTRIVAMNLAGELELWNAQDGQFVGKLGKARPRNLPWRFSPDSTHILTASKNGEEGTTRLWDARDGALVTVVKGEFESANCASFSPDGANFAVCGEDGATRVWDRKTGRLISALEQTATQAADEPRFVKFSPDGDRVLTLGEKGFGALWDATSGMLLSTKAAAHGVARFSADGTRVATVGRDGSVKLWNAAGEQLVATLETDQGLDPNGFFALLAAESYPIFSPDAARMVTIQYDGTTRLWDVRTGEPIAALQGKADMIVLVDHIVSPFFDPFHPSVQLFDDIDLFDHIFNPALAVTFSPDGSRVRTVSIDGTALLHDASDGRLVNRIHDDINVMNPGIFSPDGQLLITLTDPAGLVADRTPLSALWLPLGIIVGLFVGLRSEVRKSKSAPNEGIRLSARHAVIVGMVGGLAVALSVSSVFAAYGESVLPDGRIVLGLFMIVATLGALLSGGLDVIQHYILRFILFASRATPWRYSRFLDHAAHCILLRRVGGGYIFIHRLLLEYFSRQPPSGAKAKVAKRIGYL